MSLPSGLTNKVLEMFNILHLFTLNRIVARLAKRNAIVNVKSLFGELLPRVDMMGLNVASAGASAQLAGVVVPSIDGRPPFFVLKTGVPLLPLIIGAALPLWIFLATKTPLEAVGDSLFGVWRKFSPIPGAINAGALFGNLAKAAALLFRHPFAFIPSAQMFAIRSLWYAVLVKQPGDTNLRRSDYIGNLINAYLLNNIEAIQRFFVGHYSPLRRSNIATFNAALIQPVIDRLMRLDASDSGDLFARLLFRYVQPAQSLFVKHVFLQNAMP